MADAPQKGASGANGAMLGLTHGAGHFDPTKAGMQGVSKEKVAQVVREMSEGSKYYENAQQRDKQLEERLVSMKARLLRVTSSELKAFDQAMHAVASKAEAQERDLSQVWVVVDMDAFYASVEIRDRPDLANVPMAVGGMGMITTANYEARKFGVRAAMPGFIGKRLCPQLVFVRPNFDKYTAAAEEVRAVLRKYDPDFQAMSLDEAYLCLTPHLQQHGILPGGTGGSGGHGSCDGRDNDGQHDDGHDDQRHNADGHADGYDHDESWASRSGSGHAGAAAGGGSSSSTPSRKRRRDESSDRHIITTGSHRLPRAPTAAETASIAEVVAKMRAEVKEATRGLTCSAGIGPNPMLAKIASNDNKPDGQAVVPWDRSAIVSYMSKLAVRSIPGVGKVTERMLVEIGLKSCADVLAQKGLLRAAFNERMSCWLLRCALGIASADRDSELHGHGSSEDGVGRKSISMERTFRDTSDYETLKAKAVELAQGVASDMSKEGILGHTVTLKMKLHTFEVLQRSATLAQPSADSAVLTDAAVSLLKAAWPVTLRLLGFRMYGLSKALTKPTALDAFMRKRANATVGAAASGAGASSAGAIDGIAGAGAGETGTDAGIAAAGAGAGASSAGAGHHRSADAEDEDDDVVIALSQDSSPHRPQASGDGAGAAAGSPSMLSPRTRRGMATVSPARHQSQNIAPVKSAGLLSSYFALQAAKLQAGQDKGRSPVMSAAHARGSGSSSSSGAASGAGHGDQHVLVHANGQREASSGLTGIDGDGEDGAEDDDEVEVIDLLGNDEDGDDDDYAGAGAGAAGAGGGAACADVHDHDHGATAGDEHRDGGPGRLSHGHALHADDHDEDDGVVDLTDSQQDHDTTGTGAGTGAGHLPQAGPGQGPSGRASMGSASRPSVGAQAQFIAAGAGVRRSTGSGPAGAPGSTVMGTATGTGRPSCAQRKTGAMDAFVTRGADKR